MAKVIDCGQVNPASGCTHVIRAESEAEALKKAREHARTDHGMELTPDLEQKVRGAMRDE
jgi:predicted small metal-binding protein